MLMPLKYFISFNPVFGVMQITGIDSERLGLYCNHTHPPPLITPASGANVHFHSDSSGQDVGFQIHYSIVEGIYIHSVYSY